MEISTVIEEQDPTWMTPIIGIPHKQVNAPSEQKLCNGAYAARRRDSNFERVSSIDVRPTTMAPIVRPIQATIVQPRDSMQVRCSMHSRTRSVVQEPSSAGGLKFLIVAIDYFTKWIEAKCCVATITGIRHGGLRVVYRVTLQATLEDTGKLGQSGKDPTRLRSSIGKGAYKLCDMVMA
ncbi:hypothetical protein Tco_1517115 [Tanacetum coccineum]